GDTKQAIVADEQGRFDAPGRYNITLYPVARGPDHPARFTGSTDGHVMTLTVTLTDTAVTLGPVQLELGKEPRMGPWPICREPGGPSVAAFVSPVRLATACASKRGRARETHL